MPKSFLGDEFRIKDMTICLIKNAIERNKKGKQASELVKITTGSSDDQQINI